MTELDSWRVLELLLAAWALALALSCLTVSLVLRIEMHRVELRIASLLFFASALFEVGVYPWIGLGAFAMGVFALCHLIDQYWRLS